MYGACGIVYEHEYHLQKSIIVFMCKIFLKNSNLKNVWLISDKW